jgi:hypothetical protein
MAIFGSGKEKDADLRRLLLSRFGSFGDYLAAYHNTRAATFSRKAAALRATKRYNAKEALQRAFGTDFEKSPHYAYDSSIPGIVRLLRTRKKPRIPAYLSIKDATYMLDFDKALIERTPCIAIKNEAAAEKNSINYPYPRLLWKWLREAESSKDDWNGLEPSPYWKLEIANRYKRRETRFLASKAITLCMAKTHEDKRTELDEKHLPGLVGELELMFGQDAPHVLAALARGKRRSTEMESGWGEWQAIINETKNYAKTCHHDLKAWFDICQFKYVDEPGKERFERQIIDADGRIILAAVTQGSYAVSYILNGIEIPRSKLSIPIETRKDMDEIEMRIADMRPDLLNFMKAMHERLRKMPFFGGTPEETFKRGKQDFEG